MRLIGISGLKTSGKDTTYKAINDLLPDLNVQRVAFADKLKEAAAKAIGFPQGQAISLMDECKENWTFAIYDGFGDDLTTFTGREYLQWFGTQAGREVFGDEFWVDLILPEPLGPGHFSPLDDLYPDADVLVVTDARFPNEARRIKQLGGEMWEVTRPGLEGDGHASEQPLPADLVDIRIDNSGTLADLVEQVRGVLYSRV